MGWDYWRDYSDLHGSPGWRHVVTVPNDHGFYITAFLSTVVTVAGGSAWKAISLLIHAHLARKGTSSDVFGLQQQVALRNPGSPFRAAMDAFMIHWSWGKVPLTRRLRRTAMIAIPGLIVWASFTIASIVVSFVATQSNDNFGVRVTPQRCGFRTGDPDKVDGAGLDPVAMSDRKTDKITNDTIEARAYALSMRSDMVRNGEAQSHFFKRTLDYTSDLRARCLFPEESYCLVAERDRSTSISFTSKKLSSHLDLGINAPPEDRIFLQHNATCSLVKQDYPFYSSDENWLYYNLGPVGNATEKGTTTIRFPVGDWNDTMGYNIEAGYAPLNPRARDIVWRPVEGIARDDADLGYVFLMQNGVRYSTKVEDPWMTAVIPTSDNQYQSEYWVNLMVCSDQYRWCSSAADDDDDCTQYGGSKDLWMSANNDGTLEFNAAQRATAVRLSFYVAPRIVDSAVSMGAAALFASRKVRYNLLSSGLPETQWHIEVAGWFETALADWQGTADEFVRKGDNLKVFEVLSPGNDSEKIKQEYNFTQEMVDTLRDQCYNQLVIDTGKMQNFSFGGVIIVIVVSACLVLLGSWFSEILDLCSDMRLRFIRRRHHPGKDIPAASQTKIARQADDRLHLLRYALDAATTTAGGAGRNWHETTFTGVPVIISRKVSEDMRQKDLTVRRPVSMQQDNNLFEYPKYHIGVELSELEPSEHSAMFNQQEIPFYRSTPVTSPPAFDGTSTFTAETSSHDHDQSLLMRQHLSGDLGSRAMDSEHLALLQQPGSPHSQTSPLVMQVDDGRISPLEYLGRSSPIEQAETAHNFLR